MTWEALFGDAYTVEDDDDGFEIDLRTEGAYMGDIPLTNPADGSATAWVSVAEAAEKSGVGTSTVRQWYRSGRIPTQRAEGERGAFLVPLHAVLALAQQADEEGDDLGAALIDLNASYWSAQTEAAREDATVARHELAQARAELADATSELTASRDQLAFLRAQLAEASEDARGFRNEIGTLQGERERLTHENRRLRDDAAQLQADLGVATDEAGDARSRIAALEQELAKLRAITSATASITDNSWLELPTNTYRSPVRPQGMAAADALSGLLASTQPDVVVGDPDPDTDAVELASLNPTAFDDERFVDEDDAALDGPEEPAPAPFAGFGKSDDDLLPEPEKKGRRGRK